MSIICLVKILYVVSSTMLTLAMGIENPTARDKRIFYIPLNIKLPGRQVTTLAPGAANGGTATLTVAENVAVSLINGIRAAHQAPPVTFSAQLRTQAQQCIAKQIQNPDPDTNQCTTNNQGVTWGSSAASVASRGIREVITSTVRGWQAAYLGDSPDIDPNTYWSNPTPVANGADYTQMIWRSTTQVGCAYSAQPAASGNYQNQYFFICIWSPPGNDLNSFPQNVLQDTQ